MHCCLFAYLFIKIYLKVEEINNKYFKFIVKF